MGVKRLPLKTKKQDSGSLIKKTSQLRAFFNSVSTKATTITIRQIFLLEGIFKIKHHAEKNYYHLIYKVSATKMN